MNYHVPAHQDDAGGATLPLPRHSPYLCAPPSTQQMQFKHPGASHIDPNLGGGGGPGGSPEQHSGGMRAPLAYSVETPRAGALTPSTPSRSMTMSPRHQARSPSQTRQALPSFVPPDRSLPPRDVTDDTIDDAYADFILYCNPVFPLATDTTELRKLFRQAPKSDGKSFSIWHLYELVRRYEEKEIKTWVELALELGVEKPALDKGQSTQKVQQYSVRLKRWMRAMHVDSFFDYLRGCPKDYYTSIPPPHAPHPESGRDGVVLEEDLAIRALDPSLRPKR
ncbi:MAG: hypothetical protein INR71_09600, partial [Terriglobus roseus]|nr:hypothetical protein [Terriglobus roseus]